MNNPQNPSKENDPEPFDDFPEEEMPIIDDTEVEVEASEEIPEAASSDEYVEAIAEAKKISSTHKKSPRKKLHLILACVGAFLVGIIGWLGWSYWVDRDTLATLTSDLMTARDRAENSKGNPEESGETAAGNQLSFRLRTIVLAPWWDQVVVRILNQKEIVRAQEESSDLDESAKNRTANRAWWAEQLLNTETALAVEDRTIPTIQGILDDLQSAQPPHPSDGGFTDEMLSELAGKMQADLASLTTQQDAMIAQLQQKFLMVSSAQNQDELLSARKQFESPVGIDRNPPELQDYLSKSTIELQSVEALLYARDAIEVELTSALASIASTDLEIAPNSSMQSIIDALQTLQLPEDSRYEVVRQLKKQAIDKAGEILAILTSRDAALEWIVNQKTKFDQIETLSDISEFANSLAESDPPQSELPIVIAATEDFVARISARTQLLIEQQRLLDISIARQQLCEQLLFDLANSNSFMSLLKDGQIANAATVLLTAEPESNDQIAEVQKLKDGFPKSIIRHLNEMTQRAESNGNWPSVANEFRNCLNSNSVAVLAPRFKTDSAELWKTVELGEDKTLYAEIQQLSKSPYAQLEPAARWYLDSARTLGATPEMKSQVSALLDSIQIPEVTLQIEGIEWSATQCQWADPQTNIAIVIGRIFHQFGLDEVSENESTPLKAEQVIREPRETPIEIAINGQFSCSDSDGIFSGTGSLTVDDLRTGGRFSLPFWNHGDQSLPAHQLLLISVPDENIRVASDLPAWSNSR